MAYGAALSLETLYAGRQTRCGWTGCWRPSGR